MTLVREAGARVAPSPPIHDTLAVLGREETLRRIDAAVNNVR